MEVFSFDELSKSAKEQAKDLLITMICSNDIPESWRFDEKGNIIRNK